MTEQNDKIWRDAELAQLRAALAQAQAERDAALQDAQREIRYLECGKCGTCYEAEPANEYPNGVLCPRCKELGYTVVGVCHLVVGKENITQLEWNNMIADRDAALARAERWRRALVKSDPWNDISRGGNLIDFTCVHCDAQWYTGVEYDNVADAHNPGCVYADAVRTAPAAQEGGQP